MLFYVQQHNTVPFYNAPNMNKYFTKTSSCSIKNYNDNYNDLHMIRLLLKYPC